MAAFAAVDSLDANVAASGTVHINHVAARARVHQHLVAMYA